MGMDVNEYKNGSVELGEGLNTLTGKLYGAIAGNTSWEDVKDLLEAGEKKIALFEKLSAQTTGGMHDGLQKKYLDFIEAIRTYSQELKEKYHDRIG